MYAVSWKGDWFKFDAVIKEDPIHLPSSPAPQLTQPDPTRTGIDLFAAPYDWRYSPDVLKSQGYFMQLKALIESAYASSGNRRVHLLGHSLVRYSSGWLIGWIDALCSMCIRKLGSHWSVDSLTHPVTV